MQIFILCFTFTTQVPYLPNKTIDSFLDEVRCLLHKNLESNSNIRKQISKVILSAAIVFKYRSAEIKLSMNFSVMLMTDQRPEPVFLNI